VAAPAYTDVIEGLKLHGIRYETIDAPRTMTLDKVRILDPKLKQASEGRVPLEARFAHEDRKVTLPAGTIRVPSDQPLGLLAAALLEPESQDSFFAWGFFHETLQPAPGTEAFVLAPMADRLLQRDAGVRAALAKRLAADPAFAADAEARLAWLAARLLPPDPYARSYPVLRER
jgi:hypothetical protein